MKGLIQRVKSAQVDINGKTVGHINQGILLLLGIEKTDTEQHAAKLLDKILKYRIFSDEKGKMNNHLQQINGGLLIVSQFTLVADTAKGLRPSFSSAAPPEQAKNLYNYFITQANSLHSNVATGDFAANMQISLINDGPVTFQLST